MKRQVASKGARKGLVETRRREKGSEESKRDGNGRKGK